MSHVMVPDGVLPLWLSAAGWVGAILLVAVALWRLRGQDHRRLVPRLAVMTALMVVVMSFELVPLGYEPHLSALAGIVIGPWYGVLAALLFNMLRAMIGDGAVTNIGLNTVITALELAAGWALYGVALRVLGRRIDAPGLHHLGPHKIVQAKRPVAAAAAAGAAVGSLMLGTGLFLAVIAAAGLHPSRFSHAAALSDTTGSIRGNPFAEGIVNMHLPGDEHEAGAIPGEGQASFTRFAVILTTLALIGWVLEGALTAMIVSFLVRVRPDLVRLVPVTAAPAPTTLAPERV